MRKLTLKLVERRAKPKNSNITDKNYYICMGCGGEIHQGQKYHRLTLILQDLEKSVFLKILCKDCYKEVRKEVRKTIEDLFYFKPEVF